jgi:RecG-like helicase
LQAWTSLRSGRRRVVVRKPSRLNAALDTLPGVGPTVKRKLAKLGLETVRDLLEHRPRRYEDAAPEVRIAALGGDDEVVIAGEVLNVSSRRRGRLTIITVKISDGTRPSPRRSSTNPGSRSSWHRVCACACAASRDRVASR